MPTIRENREYWDSSYDWSQAGDEWSESWGSTEQLWFGTLLPRLQGFLPTGTILEIAPGFGRWSQFLAHHCERLVLVDLAERCIEGCKERFAALDHVEYHVNDGKTLAAVDDRSVDLAYSFDSLVHVEADVLESYVHELGAKLADEGVAFIHHSNLGRFRRLANWVRKMPLRLQYTLNRRLINLSGWRSETMTAERFRGYCDDAGLRCIGQENIVWIYGRCPIDTLSVVTRPGSRFDKPFESFDNLRFMEEAERAQRIRRLFLPPPAEKSAGEG